VQEPTPESEGTILLYAMIKLRAINYDSSDIQRDDIRHLTTEADLFLAMTVRNLVPDSERRFVLHDNLRSPFSCAHGALQVVGTLRDVREIFYPRPCGVYFVPEQNPPCTVATQRSYGIREILSRAAGMTSFRY